MTTNISENSEIHSVRAATINLSSIDLNLLVGLEALLAHCNVTHAADKVGLSQPAMSRALSRLRGMFDDDLLVRTSGGYVRTIRGDQLHDRLPAMLDGVRELVTPMPKGADGWRSTIHMAMPDHQALVWLSGLLDRLSVSAADTEIVTEPLMPGFLKRLENGEIEMAVGQRDGRMAGFYQRTLYLDDYVCLLRDNHPTIGCPLSPEQFYSLRHAVCASGRNAEYASLVDILSNVPPRQRITVSPNMMGTALAVAESDMVLVVPRRVALRLANLLPLRVFDLPVSVPSYEIKLLWHERSHRNPEHKWVRTQIVAAVHDSDPPRPAVPDVASGIDDAGGAEALFPGQELH